MKRTRLNTLAASALAASVFMPGGVASAANFEFGEVSVALDNTVSLGAGLRASPQDCKHIADINGGCGAGEVGFDCGKAFDRP